MVLHDLDWTAQTDERWVVLGPNGSGKTSILRLLSFVRAPSRGTVTVLGDRYGAVDVRRARRRIGLASSAMLQQLRPSLERARRRAHRGRRRAGDVVVDVRRRRSTRAPTSCSTSWVVVATPIRSWRRSRKASASGCSSARVLMADPDLLLFDEPCAGLDLGGREAMVEVLGDLARDGLRPLVMVTHHLEEIPPGITHALLLRQGQVVAAGPGGRRAPVGPRVVHVRGLGDRRRHRVGGGSPESGTSCPFGWLLRF